MSDKEKQFARLARFHRSRFAHYVALIESGKHPVLECHWRRYAQQHIQRAVELETRI